MTPILQRDHRSVMGRILYTSRKPERLGQERGREYFRIDTHASGARTVTAHCEIDDRPSVMRDITYALDAGWMPTDCFVRLSVGDRFTGSGWFRFAPGVAECETWTAAEGRVRQTMALATPLVTFQNHAIHGHFFSWADSQSITHMDMRQGNIFLRTIDIQAARRLWGQSQQGFDRFRCS